MIKPAFLVVIALTASALAEEPLRAVGFQPLEIYTFKPGSSRLYVEDLNNDGLDDVIFANNHVSRLEILLRKPDSGETVADLPDLEERFDDQGIIVDQGIKSLRIADLNGDGLQDIATFGTALGLTIRYQQDDGAFAVAERIFIKDIDTVATFKVEDLNGDGLNDIIICRRDQADLLWNSPGQSFQERKILPFSGDNCYFCSIGDVNIDGIPDLLFHFTAKRNPLKIRYGKGDGLFGVEQPVDLAPRQYTELIREENKPLRLGMVLKNRLAFRLYGFEEMDQPQIMDAQDTTPRRIGLEGTSRKAAPAWLVGDFNGDGYDDLLVTAPELSRLHLYPGGEEGLDPEPERIDTLSQAVHLSRMASGEILVVSSKEKIAAVHSAQDLAQFPRILQAPGDVLAGCAVESGSEAWLVCKDEDKKLKLARIPGDGTEGFAYDLDIKNDPSGILAFQLPENKTGIILFMPYANPRMMVAEGEEITELTSESFRALAQALSYDNIQLARPGDGAVLTVSQGAIARRFEWKGDRYEAVRQFNPENPQGELIASCSYRLSDGAEGTMLYDRNTGDLVYFSSGGEWGKIHINDADPNIFNLVQLGNGQRDIILLIDRTGISEIIGNGKRLEAVAGAEYTSPSEEPLLAYAIDVRLGSPPEPMIALVDAANRAIEIVKEQDGELKQEISFEVFLISDFADVHASRTTEPHDLESGDLNGDGIGDLVVLSQDKLLIYLGE
jgi:hypothetical protein